MENQKYQIQTRGGLSKAYTVRKLLDKRDGGYVPDEAQCTPDGGITWIPLGRLLAACESQMQSGETTAASSAEFTPTATRQELHADGGSSSSSAVMFAPPTTERSAAGKADDPEDSQFVSGAHAANVALQTAMKKRQERKAAAARAEMQPPPERPVPERRQRSALLSGMAGALIVAGLFSVGYIFFGPSDQFDATNPTALLQFDDVNENGTFETMDLEELSVRTRVMTVQLNRLAHQLSDDKSDVPVIDLPEWPSERKLPLVPFTPPELSAQEQAETDELLRRYANLVQEKGADGRGMDQQTVDLFSRHLTKLMTSVGGRSSDRAAAVHDLAERTKLLYLLQLRNTKSADTARQSEGRRAILDAANRGLERLYTELALKDMHYSDVLFFAEPAEQRELILIRYWYHRAGNSDAAAAWLDQVISLIEKGRQSYIRDSISEVDAIESRK